MVTSGSRLSHAPVHASAGATGPGARVRKATLHSTKVQIYYGKLSVANVAVFSRNSWQGNSRGIPKFSIISTRIFFDYFHWFCSQNFRNLKVQLSFFEQFGTFPRYLPSFGRFQNFWSNGGERAVPIPQLFAFEEVSRTLRFLTTFIWDKLNELGYVDLVHR